MSDIKINTSDLRSESQNLSNSAGELSTLQNQLTTSVSSIGSSYDGQLKNAIEQITGGIYTSGSRLHQRAQELAEELVRRAKLFEEANEVSGNIFSGIISRTDSFIANSPLLRALFSLSKPDISKANFFWGLSGLGFGGFLSVCAVLLNIRSINQDATFNRSAGAITTKPNVTFGDLNKQTEKDKVQKPPTNFHQINQFDAMYAQYKLTSNSDCGPTSLVMALSSLGLGIPGSTAGSSDGELIFLTRKLMVTDKSRDGLTDQGNISIAEHQTYVTSDEVISGARAAGAQAGSINPDAKSIQNALGRGDKVIAFGTFTGKKPLPWTGDRGHDNNTAPGGATKHIVAVTGYDPKTKLFTVNDPAREEPIQITGATLEAFMQNNAGAVAVGR